MKYSNYLISEDNGNNNHAGSKARNDIDYFLKENVSEILRVEKFFNSNGIINKVKILCKMTIDWSKIIYKIDPKSNIVIQYPLESPKEIVNFFIKMTKKVKDAKLIAVIHDLESLRFDSKRKKSEIEYLNEYNYIIAHNKSMKQYLVNQGIDENKLITLGIFDYKADEINKKNRNLTNEIAIAGNLSSDKSGYVYALGKFGLNLKFNLYGPNYKEYKNDNLKYFGQFPPEKLPKNLQGSFGLVWDGSEINDCVGITGEYLKYNNPHKVSLYIVSNLPIIIWKKAAMADFVVKEKIGIAVDSLEDIYDEISKLKEEDYQNMINNINNIANRLKKGYYINNAVKDIL